MNPDHEHTLRGASARLEDLLKRLRRRWRARETLGALALAGTGIVLAAVGASVAMSYTRFDPGAVNAARLLTYLVASLLVLGWVLPRILRRLDDAAVARHAEAQADLDALLVSAVSARRALDANDPAVSAPLARRLLARAADRGPALDAAPDRRASLHAGAAFAAVLVLLLAAIAWGPAWLRHGLLLQLGPAADPAQGNPFSLAVQPGDALVGYGEDQLVVAQAQAFAPAGARLWLRSGEESPWREVAMAPGSEGFSAFVRGLAVPTDYYVEAEGVRSAQYRLEVTRLPQLRELELVYHFPAYSGRAPERVQGGGDIRAPRGSRVDVHAFVEHASAGQLLLNGVEAQTLEPDTGYLATSLEIDEDGHYRVELATADGRMLPVSPEFTIEALLDLPPSVRLRRPGSDARVSSIEEVDVALEAEDDIAVRTLELVLSVNGGDEEVVSLAGESAQARIETAHTLALEERDMQAGDLIAYYARARDGADAHTREVVTDIFFMEVRPFEREYRRGNGGGGGGGGGGGQNDEQLAAQQRMLVIALFNTVRDRHRLEEQEYHSRLAGIGAAQARIRDRVEAIARRLQARSIVQLDPGYQQMARELPLAAAAMEEVEAQLQAGEGAPAQPPARNALLHLQRAEAAFRSVQVTRSLSDGRNSTGDLQDLFRLEMDRFRNQYADVRRGRWQADSEGLDETLRRLRELARRQQQEVERARLRGERGESAGARSQRALAEEAERMARELERLSRERKRPELQDLARQLRQAAESMREASRRGDGVADSRAALERLNEARRLLDGERPQRLARDVDEALRLARSLEQRQGSVRRGLDEAEDDAAAPGENAASQADGEGAADLQRQKDAMQAELNELRSRLQQGRARARAQPEVGRRLGDADDTLREDDVANKVNRSRRALAAGGTPDPELERQIERTLRDARRHIEAAAEAVARSDDSGEERARQRLAEVVRGLNRLQQGGTQAGAEAGGQNGAEAGGQADAGGAPAQAGGFGNAERAPGAPGANANLRGALRAYGQALQGVRDALAMNPKAVGDLQQVIDGLFAQADATGDPGAGGAELLATLQRLERDLRLARDGEPAPLIATARGEPPERYRRLVSDYYRALSDDPR